ncbi:MAG: M48 family metallopeptidase [Candidatus Levybacteria bacterium]|nr:M48 family metallopeptidase [Candidatus Levybacteria bacterium]
MADTPTITIIRSKRSTVALHVLPDGSLEVKAPMLMPKFFINRFIEKNKEWIQKRTALVQQKKALEKIYKDGEAFLYLGETYPLVLRNVSRIEIAEGKLFYPQAIKFRIKKEIEQWYIAQAKEIITREVKRYAKEMNTTYTDLTFSDTKSQWGRCTHDNRLQFSWRLVMTPLLVLRYVVVHELAHTFEKNHSYLFWSKVRSVNPSYKQQIKWLKENGNTLVV